MVIGDIEVAVLFASDLLGAVSPGTRECGHDS
jgi:hypothetical protein